MPFGDGTGPNGQGPRTGRGMGNCNGQSAARGRGFGGRGRGWGYNNAPASQDTSWLQTQISELQAAIQKLTERLDQESK